MLVLPTKVNPFKVINKNQLLGFPFRMAFSVSKHLPLSTATVKGIMHGTRLNLCSTKSKKSDSGNTGADNNRDTNKTKQNQCQVLIATT